MEEEPVDVSGVAAPATDDPRLERLHAEYPFLIGVPPVDNVVATLTAVEILVNPQHDPQHYLAKIDHIRVPGFRRRFFEWVSQKKQEHARNLNVPYLPIANVAEVPNLDYVDDSDDEDEIPSTEFGFSEEDHLNYSHIIMLLHWIRAQHPLRTAMAEAPAMTTTQTILGNLARSQSQESMRSFINTFFDDLPTEPSGFLGLLLTTLDFYSRKLFCMIINRTRRCPLPCSPELFLSPDTYEILEGGSLAAEISLGDYTKRQLENEQLIEEPCSPSCAVMPSVRTKIFLKDVYFVLSIAPQTGIWITVGPQDTYTFNGQLFKISALIKKMDGLYCGWIREGDGFTYYRKGVRRPRAPLPPNLSNICIIIFARDQ